MRLLLSAFEPYGIDSLNSSWEVARRVDAVGVDGVEIALVQLPVGFERAERILFEAIDSHKPDVVLMLGQANGKVRLERVAINLKDARNPDNDGYQPIDEPISTDGDVGYFSTLPLRKLYRALVAADIPVTLSGSAGVYVCNYIFYRTLERYASAMSLKVGFVHLPYLPEQAELKPTRQTLPLDAMCRAVEIIIQTLSNEYQGI